MKNKSRLVTFCKSNGRTATKTQRLLLIQFTVDFFSLGKITWFKPLTTIHY